MNKKHWVLLLVCSLASVGVGYVVHAEGAPTTQPLFYSGVLEDAGALAEGDYTISLTLHDALTAGNVVCTSETAAVPVVAGRFRMDVSDCADELQTKPDTWAAVQFTGSDGTPHAIPGRTKVGAVPYAMEAQHAAGSTRLGTLVEADVQRRVAAAGCGANTSIRVVGADGAVTCETDDNTTYGASNGIALSGTTFVLGTPVEYGVTTVNGTYTTPVKAFCALSQVYVYADAEGKNPDCRLIRNSNSTWTLSAINQSAAYGYVECKIYCI